MKLKLKLYISLVRRWNYEISDVGEIGTFGLSQDFVIQVNNNIGTRKLQKFVTLSIIELIFDELNIVFDTLSREKATILYFHPLNFKNKREMQITCK